MCEFSQNQGNCKKQLKALISLRKSTFSVICVLLQKVAVLKGGMTFAREFFVCLILAADFTVGAHTFRRVCRCVRSFSESRYPLSGMKANVGRLCEKLKSEMKSGWGIKFMAAALPDFSLLLIVGVHREPGNVCI